MLCITGNGLKTTDVLAGVYYRLNADCRRSSASSKHYLQQTLARTKSPESSPEKKPP